MSNNKQSSVEWLHHEFERIDKEFHVGTYEYNYAKNLAFKISKAMHKEEIFNTIVDCEKEHIIQAECYPPQFVLTKAEHYYIITFGGNNDIH